MPTPGSTGAWWESWAGTGEHSLPSSALLLGLLLSRLHWSQQAARGARAGAEGWRVHPEGQTNRIQPDRLLTEGEKQERH